MNKRLCGKILNLQNDVQFQIKSNYYARLFHKNIDYFSESSTEHLRNFRLKILQEINIKQCGRHFEPSH